MRDSCRSLQWLGHDVWHQSHLRTLQNSWPRRHVSILPSTCCHTRGNPAFRTKGKEVDDSTDGGDREENTCWVVTQVWTMKSEKPATLTPGFRRVKGCEGTGTGGLSWGLGGLLGGTHTGTSGPGGSTEVTALSLLLLTWGVHPLHFLQWPPNPWDLTLGSSWRIHNLVKSNAWENGALSGIVATENPSKSSSVPRSHSGVPPRAGISPRGGPCALLWTGPSQKPPETSRKSTEKGQTWKGTTMGGCR